jgi:hypothetical protein
MKPTYFENPSASKVEFLEPPSFQNQNFHLAMNSTLDSKPWFGDNPSLVTITKTLLITYESLRKCVHA